MTCSMAAAARRLVLGMTAAVLVVGVAGSLVAPRPAAAKPLIHQDDGVAINGHDVVAYHTDGKPVAGKPQVTASWRGATWRFASADHRDLFIADPAAYAPQYNGYCAWAAASGYLASTDPEAWQIVEGKLYLNYSQSVRRRWQRTMPANIRKGDANWPRLEKTLD